MRRLDQVLSSLGYCSRREAVLFVKNGRVKQNGLVLTKADQKVDPQAVTVDDEPLEALDGLLAMLHKPVGYVCTHDGNEGPTIYELLPDQWLRRNPAVTSVGRLDKDTSGLLVVAKTLEAQTDLVRQLQARTVKREYQALARGLVERGGTVDAPIGRHPTQRIKMAVIMGGKPARTHYRVVEAFSTCTLIECSLETGRTHQIRVHLDHIGHPLVGDPVYGRGASRLPGPAFHRQFLHARKLGLVHPASGKTMLWKSPLPDDMADLLEQLRINAVMEADAACEEDDYEDEHEVELIYEYGDGDDD